MFSFSSRNFIPLAFCDLIFEKEENEDKISGI